MLDMSYTVSHQDYTVRHVTNCQSSGLHGQSCHTLSVIRTTRLDMSYIVSHQDYTVRHVTHCQSSGLHCQMLNMSYTVRHQDYTVRHVTHCRVPRLHCQTCHTVSVWIIPSDMSFSVDQYYTVGHAVHYWPDGRDIRCWICHRLWACSACHKLPAGTYTDTRRPHPASAHSRSGGLRDSPVIGPRSPCSASCPSRYNPCPPQRPRSVGRQRWN